MPNGNVKRCRWSRSGCHLAILSMLFLALAVSSEQALADEPVDFNRDIRPILAENCFSCHGFDHESRAAGLRLDDRQSAIDSGAIDVEKPEASGLLERIFSDDVELVMPPPSSKKSLTDQQKKLLQAWIKQGAVYKNHWSFEAEKKPSPPEVKDRGWPKNPIDQFVLNRLESVDLKPASAANPAIFFRRLHLDITGLPPATKDLAEFLAEYEREPEATLSNWIDKLMGTTAWGEHRGRYWLDAARYADTHGLHFDNYREMWPYRDWVIRAFNANQRYDQFVVEQIAGDLLPSPSDEQLVATGFQRCNATTNEGGTIEEENLAFYAADRVQTVGWVFLGLTLNCAQCHDHKFDSITAEDYYAMAAFFRNTTQTALDGNVKDGRGPFIHLPKEEDQARWRTIPGELEQLNLDRDKLRENSRTDFEKILANLDPKTVREKISSEQLLLHAPFNDGGGEQITNSTGTSLVGLGNVTWNPDQKFGPAPSIAKESNFLVGDIGDWGFDDSFSYGAWVKTPKKNHSGSIIARMDTNAGFRGWDLMQASGRYQVHLIDSWPGNSMKIRTENEVIVNDQWQHVFVTYDGSRKPEGIRIYVNGLLQTTAIDNNTLKPAAELKTTTPTRIGQRRADQYWIGMIQELRIYQRSLSATEVQEIVWGDELSSLLAIEAAKRTPERLAQCLDVYLGREVPAYAALSAKISELEQELNAIRNRSPITHIQKEKMDSSAEAHILMRGAYDKKGELVKANTPKFLAPMPEALPRNRLGLAQWIVSPANPLFGRVTVNRFWQEIFGIGLVSTPDDFGVMGAPPSHPELLEWLAADFRETGFDVKRFYKQIFMSATYRQDAATTAEKMEKDLQNSLLSRAPRFRMDAEMIRDHALLTSGLLSRKMFGSGTRPYQPGNIWDVVGLPEGNTRDYVQDKGEELYRRSVYTFWKRMAHPPNLEIMNAPSREVCAVRRERTNTPLQALVTLNDPIFVESARNLAQLILMQSDSSQSQEPPSSTSSPETDFERLNQIAARVLSRPLVEKEKEILSSDLRHYREFYQNSGKEAEALTTVGESKPTDKVATAELAAWTMICQQFLNLDEAITK